MKQLHEQMSLDEIEEGSTSAPLNDGRMERCERKQVKDNAALLTWHACQGYQIVRGQRWEQNRKEGTVLSQAGRAGQVREPSVKQEAETDCSFL